MLQKQFQKLTLRNETKERLDGVLAQNLKISRSQAQKWIKKGLIRVNKKSTKASRKVNRHDEIAYLRPRLVLSELKPEPIPLEILFEDKNLLVINKPAGMVVHPDETGHHSGTVVHAALAHAEQLSGIGCIKRPGIVHRLDKDTSGVLMIAKNDTTHQKLCKLFYDRKVKKTYVTLVKGTPKSQSGRIEVPLSRSGTNRKKMAVSYQGRNAITKFEILMNYGSVSLLKVNIETGRTHQIRVHLASIGHPVVGDPLYGDKKLNEKFNKLGLKRQFLHAKILEIDDQKFTATLPQDLLKILKKL